MSCLTLSDRIRHSLILITVAAAMTLGASACTMLRDSDQVLTAEEQILMERLTRDPFLTVDSWERDSDGFLIVTTIQGRVKSRYIFKPDRPGEHALNIHHIDPRIRLVTAQGDHGDHGPSRDWAQPGR